MDDVDTLLQTNDPPSEAAILKVKELLSTPLKELRDIDVEIQHLERNLRDLKAKRDVVQDSVTKYNSIISLVRRIPSDILHEVFYHCLPTHRNPIMGASEAPVLLTRICSTWRSTALSSPRLWAQLHIPFSDDYLYSEEDHPQISNPRSRQEVVKTLQLRCHVLKNWLVRSRTCPLSISIYFSSMSWASRVLDEAEPDLTLEFITILALQSQRWKNLEPIMPMEVYLKLESMVSDDVLPILTGFKASLHSQRADFVTSSPPFSFPKAPNLKKVSISAGNNRFWKSSTMPVTWGHLTYLAVHSSFNIADIFHLLKSCYSLVHCKVGIMDGAFESQDDDLQESVSLLHLRSLSILEDGMNPPNMRNLYDCIDAPNLKWIDYQKMVYMENIDDLPPSPILPLLQKSAKLKKLTVSPRGLSRWNMRRVLEVVSDNITHLVLGHEPFGPSRSMGQGIRYFGPDSFDFSDFSLLHSSTISGTEIVLPHLQILEVTYGTTVADKDLLQFVISRMDLASPNSVAALESVRVNFSRPRERNPQCNIADEVSRHAELVGSRIKVELNYVEEPWNVDPMSPAYGLTEQDQWWNYDEIVEEKVPED